MTVQICRAATGPTACYAERELKRYLRKYSGAAFGEGAELTFRLELQKTMLYSWVEFDGNMYVQQNSCGGIQALLEYCRRESGGASIHGICFNHWRTAENSLTLSYAAQASGAFLPARDFYRQYAAEYAIGQPETFVELMSQLEELDIFNRDNLFNVGFCYLGCWLNPKGLGWIRRWERPALERSIQTYQRLGGTAGRLPGCHGKPLGPWAPAPVGEPLRLQRGAPAGH